MRALRATYTAGGLRAAPVLDRQGVALDGGDERSPPGGPAGDVFADADLNSAYAVLAARFPEDAFFPALIGGAGAGKLQAGLVAVLLAVIVLVAATNFS